MTLELTPRIYKPNMKWGLYPKNKIDTVTMKPLLNNQDITEVDTHEITSGVTPAGVSVTLPMADSSSIVTDQASMSNGRSSLLWSDVMGYGYVAITTIKGSYTVHLATPPANTPTATWELEGSTEYLERGVKTVSDIYNIGSTASAFAQYIHTNKVGGEALHDNASWDSINRSAFKDGLLVNYAQGWAPKFPWIRDVTADWPGGPMALYIDSIYRPKEEDILTKWNPQTSNADWLPQRASWTTYNIGNRIIQGPYYWPISGLGNNFDDRFIPIVPNKRKFYCNVTKLNSYDYRVDYELPVRYIYAAAAKSVGSLIHTTETARDSYAFKDVISKITIHLSASTYNEDTQDISYSLEGPGRLTTDVDNQHPLTFGHNELLTIYTNENGEPWTDMMSLRILSGYRNGKYIVECTVAARWAIENNVHINTEMYIKNQMNETITRFGNACKFQVKTIEKAFQDSQFVFHLRLLEV